MSKIKCTFCGKESETELFMLGEQEMLYVEWVCDCHDDEVNIETDDKDRSALL